MERARPRARQCRRSARRRGRRQRAARRAASSSSCSSGRASLPTPAGRQSRLRGGRSPRGRAARGRGPRRRALVRRSDLAPRRGAGAGDRSLADRHRASVRHGSPPGTLRWTRSHDWGRELYAAGARDDPGDLPPALPRRWVGARSTVAAPGGARAGRSGAPGRAWPVGGGDSPRRSSPPPRSRSSSSPATTARRSTGSATSWKRSCPPSASCSKASATRSSVIPTFNDRLAAFVRGASERREP